jgi:hypothetical protein
VAEPTTPLPGWVAGGAPCGTAFALEPVDDPRIGVQGGVTIGTLDRQTAAFTPDPAGSTVFLDVFGTAHAPGTSGDGSGQLTTMLVDDSGTVAFWSDEARMLPQLQATDGSRASSMFFMWDAVDCRTGRPLVGTYRAFAHQSAGPETVELAPVTFGPDGTRPPDPFVDRLPVCGQPVPDVAPDFTVALDPGVVLDGVNAAGLRAPVTVTRTGTSRLQGRVPQSMHAVLVADGVVVSQAFDPIMRRFDSGATFDVAAGESFPAEVFQWFTQCFPSTVAGTQVTTTGWAAPGTYDLYVYDVFLADDGSGTPTPRTAVGGPFPITVR